jgi:hypothetical protein
MKVHTCRSTPLINDCYRFPTVVRTRQRVPALLVLLVLSRSVVILDQLISIVLLSAMVVVLLDSFLPFGVGLESVGDAQNVV